MCRLTLDSDNILANFSRLTELRLSVAADRSLGCVVIGVDGLGEGGVSCLLSTGSAIVLVERLIKAVGELRQDAADLGPPDLGPPAGPFSSTF